MNRAPTSAMAERMIMAPLGHDHPFGQKNLDYASQAPLHPGYASLWPKR